MVAFLRYLSMFLLGAVLYSANIIFWSSWQFWAILVLMFTYGFAHNAEGYKEACGNWPWEGK